jgi:hypothetical protein
VAGQQKKDDFNVAPVTSTKGRPNQGKRKK